MSKPQATGRTTGGVQAAGIAAQPSPAATRPSRRSIATRVLLLVGIALVVFVVILPRVVDYETVGAALSSLSTVHLAVQMPGRVNVMCVTPLGEEVASTL